MGRKRGIGFVPRELQGITPSEVRGGIVISNNASTESANGTPNPASVYVPKRLPWRGPENLPELENGILYLSGFAYAKLCFWRDIQDKEVSCWGVIHPKNSFVVTDMVLVHQEVSSAWTEMQEDHMGFLTDHFFKTAGLVPRDWQTYWFHTHPKGMGPTPSGQDHTTFNSDRQAKANASIMAILAKNGDWSCKLRTIANGGQFNNDPRAIILTCSLKVEVISNMYPEEGLMPSDLREEFKALVKDKTFTNYSTNYHGSRDRSLSDYSGHNYSNYGYNAKNYEIKNIIELAVYAIENCAGKNKKLDMSPGQIEAWIEFVRNALHLGPCLILFRYAIQVDRNNMCTKLGQAAAHDDKLKTFAKTLQTAAEVFNKKSDEADFAKIIFGSELEHIMQAYERSKSVATPADRFAAVNLSLQRIDDKDTPVAPPPAQRATNLLEKPTSTTSRFSNNAVNRSINGKILPIHIPVEAAMLYMESLSNGETKTQARALIADLLVNEKTITDTEYAELDEWCEQYSHAYSVPIKGLTPAADTSRESNEHQYVE